MVILIPTLLVGVALNQASSATELTVYNQGFGFVKELRQLQLKKGRQQVAIQDVAEQIETNSVGIRSIDDPKSISVLEQNYQYDLINSQAILNKAVGGKIRLNRILPNGQRESLVGTLLSAPTAVVNGPNGGGMVYSGMVLRTDDGRIVLDPHGEVEVTSIPDGLISRPTLVWELEAANAGRNTVELSYLTQGMSWNADYVFTLGADNTADLLGWVTITNNSGASFKDAKLKLLAGDVARTNIRVQYANTEGLAAAADAAPQFKEQALFEYHLYSLQRPATVRNHEMKQISLLEGHGVKFEKRLIVDSMMGYGTWYPQEGEVGTGDIKPLVKLEFVNSEKNGLGMPLPKGNFKVYQRDASGSVQMLGEDQIDHTPKEEKLSITVGRSFDIRASRKRLSFKRISGNEVEESYSIELRNRKDVGDTVQVLERHWGDWSVSEKSMDFTKDDAMTMHFSVSLKAGEAKTITYTVHTKW